MSEENLEVLITLDDPGEDELEEDRFHLKDKNQGQQFSESNQHHLNVEDDSGRAGPGSE
jgi:hypothetical protein